MLRRAVLLLPILFSIPAANALDADYETCLKTTSKRGDIDGFRDCVIAHVNKTRGSGNPKNGVVTMFGHNGGILEMDIKYLSMTYDESDPRAEETKTTFVNKTKVNNINGYCVSLGETRKIFSNGAMIRYYDQNGHIFHSDYVAPEECDIQYPKPKK